VRYVKGDVRDEHGNGLPHAQIELRCHSGEILSATTGARGRFDLGHLSDGLYQCVVTRDGWKPVHGRIVVRKKTRYSVPIKIKMVEERTESVASEKSQAAAGHVSF